MSFRYRVVVRLRIGIEAGHNNDTRLGTAGIEIGVPIGDVLTPDPGQPDDLFQAEQRHEQVFELGYGDAWVSVVVQHAALRVDFILAPIELMAFDFEGMDDSEVFSF